MKHLFKKELTLTASPLSYIFIAFSLMVFIPNYPVLVCAFFICFGIFHSFQAGREANDTLYSTMLPVKKTDIVKSKFLFAVFIQLLALIAIGALSAVRVCILNSVEGYLAGALMNTNLAFIGYLLIVFAFFNILFIGGHFKTAYKIGIPFLLFAVAAFVTVIVGETLHFIPHLEVLNDDYHYSQLIVLGVGIIVYTVGTLLSERISEKRFNTIDL